MERKVIAYKNYFVDFYKEQDSKVQEKIEYVFDLIRYEKRVPIKLLRQENTKDSQEGNQIGRKN